MNVKNYKTREGQATVEFTFAVVIVMLIVYGLIMVFRWVGLTYAERRYSQQESLIIDNAEEQLKDTKGSYRAKHLDAVFKGKIYGM